MNSWKSSESLEINRLSCIEIVEKQSSRMQQIDRISFCQFGDGDRQTASLSVLDGSLQHLRCESELTVEDRLFGQKWNRVQNVFQIPLQSGLLLFQ